ncbi:GNAT family N-acetyltransferase [Thioalkalivibrio sp.]|uniref:GNAT family N-acetyltransferase n=1 Tax=Thioalkalivibrio sp. TaxID=2093813 RepID=UPI0012D5E501|nr:GNAT family N-acetyltransferase [Thioalkalivibrio sp.]TVP80295.1 MAG: N-acetyltransferase family protein [Thioalkalivibrio sp.]
MTTIRYANSGDAAAIAAIWNPQILDTAFTFDHRVYSVDDIAAMIVQRQAAGHVWFVVEHGGQVSGFASFAPFRQGDGYGRTMEHTIFLDPEAGGDGLGETLMQAIEHEARARGVHSLIACVTGENGVALKFHRNLGFATVGMIPQAGCKFGRWIDLVILQKMLPDSK